MQNNSLIIKLLYDSFYNNCQHFGSLFLGQIENVYLTSTVATMGATIEK